MIPDPDLPAWMAPSPPSVQVYAEPAAFAEAAQPWLQRYPVETNVLATVLGGVLAGRKDGAGVTWLAITEAGEPGGIAMHSPGWGVFLPPMSRAAVTELARYVASAGLAATRRVSGVRPVSETFAREWRGLTGAGYRLVWAERMYTTASVVHAGTSGAARPAAAADLDFVLGWLNAFRDAIGPHNPPADPGEVAGQVADGTLLLWEDGGRPVSIAGLRPAAGGLARIGPVYTPPEHRRRGYASAVTAAASREAFARGAGRCMLYTDLTNPTSNAIYQRLGYRPAADAETYAVDVPP